MLTTPENDAAVAFDLYQPPVVDLASPPLTLSGVTPLLGPSAGGRWLALYGQSFAPGASVTVLGTLSPAVVVPSQTRILALLPPGMPFGKGALTVRNLDG